MHRAYSPSDRVICAISANSSIDRSEVAKKMPCHRAEDCLLAYWEPLCFERSRPSL